MATGEVGASGDPDGRRRLLYAAIERDWPDLLIGIRIYIRKFGLSRDPGADDALARDVLQDTVLAALQSADRYDPDRPAQPWLLGFALNGLRRTRRSMEIERKHVVPVAETAEVRAAMAVRSLSESEMFDLLQAPSADGAHSEEDLDEMLAPLAGPDQELLRLHFRDDLRGKDLAAALGITEAQAWVRLSRAKTRLRRAHGTEGGGRGNEIEACGAARGAKEVEQVG